MKLDDAYRAYLKHAGTSASASSLKIYDAILRKFFRFAGVKELELLTHEHLVAWVHHLLNEEELTGGHVKYSIKITRFFFTYCEDEMWLAQSPIRWRRLPKIVKVPPTKYAFTLDHHEQILAAINAPKKRETRLYWSIACPIAYHTGLRISDVALLRWDAVDFGQGVIRVVAKKTRRFNNTLIIPMDAELVELLEDWRVSGLTYASEYVVPDMRGYYEANDLKTQFRVILDLAKISGDYSFHSYRHGFVTRLVNAGVNILTICAMTGQCPAQVQEYAHVSDEAKRAALDQAKEIIGRTRPAQRGAVWLAKNATPNPYEKEKPQDG